MAFINFLMESEAIPKHNICETEQKKKKKEEGKRDGFSWNLLADILSQMTLQNSAIQYNFCNDRNHFFFLYWPIWLSLAMCINWAFQM